MVRIVSHCPKIGKSGLDDCSIDPYLPLTTCHSGTCSFSSFVGNNFAGTIPRQFFNLSTLEYLLVSDLNTSPFKLPSESEANIPNIYSLVLRNCSIKGSIPEYISQASSLKYLDLSFNNLTDGIPESWKPNLIYMSFARNNLSGTIPTWIFQASRTRMDLSYNNFTDIPAPVPSDLNLNLFACCCCQNSSTIRPYMLQPLQMMKTYFPRGKPKFYSLFINSGGEQTTNNGILYDADNGTSGWHISSMQNWAYSSSGDFLTATINSSDYTKRVPCSEASLYEEARLSPVSLHYYALNLRKEKNYTVTLQFAEIVYSDNVEYNRLRKRIFDVYIQGENVLKDFNIRDQAEGPNRAIDRTFPKIRVENGLLDIHFYWTGKGSNHNPPVFNGPLISAISVTPEFKVGGGLTPWQKALISIASIIMAALLLLALAWGLGWLESAELQEEKDVGLTEKVKLRDIIKATNNFSTTNFIGSGSLGKVYWAQIGKDHKVAVKRLSSDFRERIHKLKAEIFYMISLKDNNLLSMLDVHVGKRYQLLIYEYMQNKSLEDIFFGSSTFPKWQLDWPTRYNICLGIGRGLKRLHKDERSVVHGNVKMTNILLDARKEPKLSDYGLAGVYTDENRILQIRNEAPKGFNPVEYISGLVSDKSDVYSFGIVVLVVISGRKSELERGAQETEYLLDKAHDLHRKGRLIELVDKNIPKNLASPLDEKQALSLLNIAVKCTGATPSDRPTIFDVLRELGDSETPMITDTITQPPTSTSKEVIDPLSEGHRFN
ncbi:Tyrosine-protein kinase [Parasponia andersonii]|uniref:non-specific serine/threonine protein kinase n=1 Tax=Parasponia andersonii TaxID=3476 RepID=A0A2P5AWS0_PARAD|nr:Tyrosine-protein kinase [Parasponia andersonii]